MVDIDCTQQKPCVFMMGEGENSHEVSITQPYRMGLYEVTFEEYELFRLAIEQEGGCAEGQKLQERVGEDQGWGRGRQPAINVSWEDARCYVEWLNQQSTGKRYRLPSEAEWEYAARAGQPTKWFWGDDEKEAVNHAWFIDNSEGKTHPVGDSKTRNDFGLYDMAGNVEEWTSSCWEEGPQAAKHDLEPWGDGPECDESRRVVRGGSWNFIPEFLRSARRGWYTPVNRFDFLGFRLAQDL
jgi:formylglycine-generating enzyme required for sulfatase activity